MEDLYFWKVCYRAAWKVLFIEPNSRNVFWFSFVVFFLQAGRFDAPDEDGGRTET